jgi:hypothetical protein
VIDAYLAPVVKREYRGSVSRSKRQALRGADLDFGNPVASLPRNWANRFEIALDQFSK